MNKKIRLSIASVLLLAAFGVFCASGFSFANVGDDIEKAVKSVAAEFSKGKPEDAKKVAVKAAKAIDDVDKLMEMYGKGGMQIDAKLKKVTVKNAAELGNLTAAMAELTLAKTPAKDESKGRTKRLWIESAEQLRAASLELAKAKDAKTVKDAYNKIENACAACHAKFKNN